jgi:phosphohistidine phosphatase SixA
VKRLWLLRHAKSAGTTRAFPIPIGLGDRFPTGALATLEVDAERWRDLDHGTATATALVTPRSLESMPGA